MFASAHNQLPGTHPQRLQKPSPGGTPVVPPIRIALPGHVLQASPVGLLPLSVRAPVHSRAMLLLVTGASGVGKSTVRKTLQPQLQPEIECAELWDLAPHSQAHTLVWRQRTTESAIKRSLQLQREGRHLLLCGDPIVAVEVAAVRSADQLDQVAFCLLDASPEAQGARLHGRGEPPSLLVHHHAFADWMRRQATDPLHMLEVVTTNLWERMRWDRIPKLAPGWRGNVIDTSSLEPLQAAAAVKSWICDVLNGTEPSLALRTA